MTSSRIRVATLVVLTVITVIVSYFSYVRVREYSRRQSIIQTRIERIPDDLVEDERAALVPLLKLGANTLCENGHVV